MKILAGDHPWRQRGGEDLPDEPVREQEVLQPVQGHHWGGLSHKGGQHSLSFTVLFQFYASA